MPYIATERVLRYAMARKYAWTTKLQWLRHGQQRGKNNFFEKINATDLCWNVTLN